MPATITLTTDLGTQEPAVASIKGVLVSGCPDASLVDLGHQIAPHQVTEAALFLLGAIPFFPGGTIHLVTVAPGPTPIVAKIAGQYVVCSDNGVLTLLADHYEVEGVRELRVPEEIANRNTQTYFGREVFAPVASALACGTPFAELGSEKDGLKRLSWPQPGREERDRIRGRIMHVDRFGNLITNVHSSHLEEQKIDRIAAGHFTVNNTSSSYDEVPPGKPLSLFGHAGYLELAYNGEPANERLQLEPGILVEVFVS